MNSSLLDPVLLRTLIAASEEASFLKVGERLGLTQQAVSVQIQKLEAAAGHRLVERRNANVRLTPRREALIAYAHLLSATTERIRQQFSSLPMSGPVRIGVVEGFATTGLAAVLTSLRKTHPDLQIGVEIAETEVLLTRVRGGSLDIAFGGERQGHAPGETIARLEMGWYGNLDPYVDERLPVRLVMRPEPNLQRTMAIEALTSVGRPYGIVFESRSRAVLQLATASDLGISVFANFSEYGRAPPTNGILPRLKPVEYFLALGRVKNEAVMAISEMMKHAVIELVRDPMECPD